MPSIVETHPEVAAQWHPAKNTIRPEEVTFGSDKKVWWLCPMTCSKGCLHEWEASISNRCRHCRGCPYCSGNKVCIHNSIVTTHPEIVKQWHPTKNININKEELSVGSRKKVWWLCPNKCSEGCIHEWETSVAKRCNDNTGCPYCINKKVCIHNSIVKTNPIIAKEWHPDKNTIKVSEVSKGSDKKVWWLCPNTCSKGCLHEWEATISSRCAGSGCPYCSNRNTCIHNSITITHPEIANQWHPTKNTICPNNVTPGSGHKIWWLCPNTCSKGCLHEWEANVSDRCNLGNGCPYCSGRQCCIHNSIATTHPEISKQWHPTKNININKNNNNISFGSPRKVWWICQNKCSEGCLHEWEATVSDRCFGYGCPYCSGNKVCIHNSIVTTHPEIVKQLHPSKNTIMTEQMLGGSPRKVWWICKKNHDWMATLYSRCKLCVGCPTCKNKTAQKLFEYIKSLYPDAISEYRADWNKNPYTGKHLPFDIFIPSLKVIIELDGAQHFKQVSNWDNPEYTQLKDVYKMRLANQNNIKVIRLLQEEVYEQPLEWLDENLKPELSKSEHPGVMVISANADVYDYHISLYESNTLEQCLEKLQALHDTDSHACNDSDESEEESEDDTDESEE